ncbi:hypothetical protein [Methanosphaera sp. WGK6]|uniref:hypothetical protein n=1 Tax=Methanosphaera sp. WGK6 TaxID=1561964 RepID=UPI00084C44CE|nr:hypothetical protein [Methanosphaera sp. WGK6]OED30896.1 hypothetical protein NL43_00880 [Methanosphaera sp. WGK6]
MYGDSGSLPLNPSRIIILLIIAIIAVFAVTIMLNGGTSTSVENNTTEVVNDTGDLDSVQETIIGNNSMGSVIKYSTYGNPDSSIKVALIVGVDQKKQGPTSIVSTLEDMENLKYAYDIYVINTTNDDSSDDTNNTTSNLTLNNKTESLAKEYAVPDMIKNNYNLTVDIHSADDSNSYVFVPSDDTYTSKQVVSYISNNTDVKKYTPDSYSFTKSVSGPLLSNNIASIVYVTNQYYSNGTAQEVVNVISVIDTFDFENIDMTITTENTSVDDANTTNSTKNTSKTNQTTNSTKNTGNVEIDE